MSDIPPISLTSSLGINLVQREQGFGGLASRGEGVVDQVEISELALRLSALEGADSLRAGKIAAIREAIANGSYETPERIDGTVDRLMDVLGLRSYEL